MHGRPGPTTSPAFLVGGGATGALIAAHDWSGTPLGCIEDWPQSLKTITAFMLRSPVPLVLLWGEDGVMLYNDAYSVFAGGRHPQLLGSNVREGWPEVADFNDNVMRVGLSGGTLAYKDQELTLYRHGRPEQVWMNLDYSPVLDETGKPAGVLAIVIETTERIAAERRRETVETALRIERDRLASVLGGMGEGFALLDPAFRILDMNAEAMRLETRPRQEIVGRTHWEAYPGSENSELGRLYKRAMAERVPVSLEHRYLWEDGRTAWLEMRAYPVADGLAIFYRDVTERGRAEAALRESEAHYRHAAELNPQVAWTANPDGQLDRVAERWRMWTGTSGLGESWGQGLHADDLGYTAEAWGRSVATGAPYDVEHRVKMLSGGYRWARSRAFPRRDDDGRIVKWYGATEDIHERKLAEERLRESEARFQAIVNSIDQMVWSTRPDGHHDFYNQRWYDYTGVPEGSTNGEAWSGMFHPEDQERAWAVWRHSLATGEPYRIEYRLRHRSGAYRWVLGRAQAVRDEAGRITRWFGTCTDIQDLVDARDVLARSREELELRVEERTAELRQAEEQLRQAQKMEAVGQLTGGIAHDFNNLLTGVIGSLDMMQRRISQGQTDNIERYTIAAMTAANRAAALTHRLLAFSRRQPLDPKPVNANRLVTGMEELLRRTIGEAISLEIVTAGGLWLTLCDPHQLESALLNLAINARDAMPEGGKLTIETCNAHLDSAYAAQSREVKPGQYVCICVTDTGAGMAPDVLAKAFDPFFTTKPIGQGTGLGLSMVYGFARQSDGYARIYSEVGQGTTVKLYLPRYYGEVDLADQEKSGLTEAHKAERGEVVLVVEDETAVRDLVVDVLEELGYRAVEAADGLSGLRLLQSDMRIDLLVTDVGLPGLNGRQLADAARQQRPDLKVMFMTGYAENATIANGFLEPGMQMITKPFAIEALATRIRDMIEGA